MIAQAPATWSQVSLKFLFSDRSIGSWGSEPENGDGVVCIRAADFETHQLTHSKNNLTKRKYSPQDILNRQLQIGDLIIEKSGGGDNQPVGRVVSFDLKQTALCSNFLERLRPDKSILHPRYGAYLFYFLWSTNCVIPFIKQTTGIQNLDINSYLSQEVRIPSIKTQKAISDFLDEKTAVIDHLITAKERLLTLLDEKRRALITHAVTRGLDSAVPLRDSGMEWIGRVPEHWDVLRIRQLMKSMDYGISERVGAEGKTVVLRMGDIGEGEIDFSNVGFVDEVEESMLLKQGDLLFNSNSQFGKMVDKEGK